MGDLVLDQLSLGFARSPAVSGLTGRFAHASLTAVVGPNGSGKSTLLKALAGHLKPFSGSIDRGGVRPSQIAYLPQAHGLDLNFPMSMLDLIGLGFMGRHGLMGGLDRRDRERLAAAIAAVGLTGLEQRPIGALSGGQLQRALFARVLVQDAQLVLLDEPFNGVDTLAAEDLAALMAQWPMQGRTVIAVLHDLDLARRLCPNTLILARKVVAWGPSDEVLVQDSLARARSLSLSWSEDSDRAPQRQPA
jgi:zinc/manganese transport system ATP-binding protein